MPENKQAKEDERRERLCHARKELTAGEDPVPRTEHMTWNGPQRPVVPSCEGAANKGQESCQRE